GPTPEKRPRLTQKSRGACRTAASRGRHLAFTRCSTASGTTSSFIISMFGFIVVISLASSLVSLPPKRKDRGFLHVDLAKANWLVDGCPYDVHARAALSAFWKVRALQVSISVRRGEFPERVAPRGRA